MAVSKRRETFGGASRGRLLAAACALVLAGNLLALMIIRPASDAGGGSLSSSSPSTTSEPGVVTVPNAGERPPVGGGPSSPVTTQKPPPAAGGATTTSTLDPSEYEWDYPATLTPQCAPIGQQFTLRLVLGVGGNAAISVVFGDGQTHDTKSHGDAGPDGIYLFTWTAQPYPGDGVAMIAAGDAGNKRNGTKMLPFRIVSEGQRC